VNDLAPTLLTPAILAALVISIMGGALSIFVVLKRLAFIGQGISHTAFGGVGIALILGIHSTTTAGTVGQLAIVTAFSIAAALGIAALSRSRNDRATTNTDTAIGVVLSASMALGFILFTLAESKHDHDHAGNASHQDGHHLIEEILFGNILTTTPTKATIAIALAAIILAYTWCSRRKLIFWAFDDSVVDAFGLNSKALTNTFLVTLALAIVMAMQIAGVVLAAAMLVLPGAAALNLTAKLKPAFILSIIIATTGAALGLLIGIKADFPAGPAIVLAQSIIYLCTLIIKTIASRSYHPS